MEKIEFDCGCSVDANGVDFDNINYDCKATWELLGTGKTQGIFQVESGLGKQLSKKLKPDNIEELAALTAIMRPGVLKSYLNDKSLTEHFIDRKHGREPTEFLHPALEPMLKQTYAVLTYQEQVIKIAQDIAGFNLKEGDDLRKGIGKKIAKVLAELKEKFVNGCINKGIISKEQAETIFEWIYNSSRYSFNKSHAISYGILGYWTAWIKQHFPLEFYTSWLIMSQEKPDPKVEIALLVNDARTFNISILPPNIYNIEKHFHIDGDAVRFGIVDVKKIGEKQVDKIRDVFNGLPEGISWFDILVHYLLKINSSSAEALVSCGVFDFTKITRRRMLYEFNVLKQVTTTNIKNLENSQANNLLEGLKYCLENAKTVSKSKLQSLINSLSNPPYSLDDSIPYLTDLEREFLGISLTCNRSSGYNYGDTVCLDLVNGKIGDVILVAEISNVGEYTINKGKLVGRTMCYLTLQDDSAELQSCILFPDAYEKYKSSIYKGAVIILKGKKEKDKSLIIETVKCLDE